MLGGFRQLIQDGVSNTVLDASFFKPDAGMKIVLKSIDSKHLARIHSTKNLNKSDLLLYWVGEIMCLKGPQDVITILLIPQLIIMSLYLVYPIA